MFNRNQTKKPSSETEGSVSESESTETDPVLTLDKAGDLPSENETETATNNNDADARYAALHDQFTRLAADFENFRKRVREEQEALARYGAQKTILELLPVLDNLERATVSLNEKSDPQVLFKSFGMVQKNLLDSLDKLGVQKVEALGKPFDPECHEAINRMNSDDVPENVVAYEAQSGYTLHGKLIRPSQVVVSMGSADSSGVAVGAETAENPFTQ